MDNFPTYSEYIHSRRDKIVKSANGYCYLITNSETFFIVLSKCIALIIAVGIPLLKILISKDLWWPYITIDCVILASLINFSINKIQYLKTTFKEIDAADIIDYDEETREWLFEESKISKRIFSIIFGSACLIFALLNSYSATYIRSQVDNNIRLSSMSITFDSTDPDNFVTRDFSESNEIIIPHDNTQYFDAYLDATVTGSPDPIRMTIDNKPITKDSIYRKHNWFWEPDYFTQNCLELVEVHDGSVLELDCGSLHREWIFRCQTE